MRTARSDFLSGVKTVRIIRITVISVLVLLTVSGTNCLIGGYSDEVHTSFAASPGYILNDSVYFIVNYRLFRRPEGIYRFPDGGISKTVLEKLYLMRYTEDRLIQVEKLSDTWFPSSAVKGTEGRLTETGLELVMTPVWGSERTLVFTIDRNPAFTDTPVSGEAEKKSITFTSNLLRRYGPGAAGLPSPLDYTKKRRRLYIRDLIELNGDAFYRKEIIRRMELSDAEIEYVLKSLEKRTQNSQGSEARRYSLTGEELMEELGNAGN